MHETSRKSALESTLRQNLSKVDAPAELWDRVRRPQAARQASARQASFKPVAWAFVATLLVVAAALSLRSHESHAAGTAELQSGDPARVRVWVRNSTGLDIALPGVLEPTVRLLGARILDAGVPSVQVAYRVGDRDATLMVAKAADSGNMRHADLRTVNSDGRITWVMHGQVYTLSCSGPASCGNPEDARAACLLCHAS